MPAGAPGRLVGRVVGCLIWLLIVHLYRAARWLRTGTLTTRDVAGWAATVVTLWVALLVLAMRMDGWVCFACC
jgi:hypothetical protein